MSIDRTTGVPFTRLAPNLDGGGIQEADRPATLLRQEFRSADLQVGRIAHQGLLVGAAPADQTASFTVNSIAGMATGSLNIKLGNFILVSGVDFIPGADVNAAAANITAAINRLAPFTAANPAAPSPDVTLTYEGTGRITFSIVHSGAVANLNTIVPANGYMAAGSPTVGPPEFT